MLRPCPRAGAERSPLPSPRRRLPARPRCRPGVEALEDRWLPATFHVTTAAAGGDGSLQQAILDANDAGGPDLIDFSIGGGGPQTIVLAVALPVVADAVVIDATTQPGFAGTPLIGLDGSRTGLGDSGLRITAGGSTVRGLAIFRFVGGSGIRLEGQGGNTITGNYLGTDQAGSAALGNFGPGLLIDQMSPDNTVRGNVIADSGRLNAAGAVGLEVQSSGNRIAGNRIGTNAAGTAALLNHGPGVLISGDGNTVGGTTAADRNLISGNLGHGVAITGSNNVIQGNWIGLAADGVTRLGNGADGVGDGVAIANPLAAEAIGNLIGGPAAGAGNVISANAGSGVSVASSDGQALSVKGNGVQGNFIGTDAGGALDRGNGGAGVSVLEAQDTVVGGAAAGARNVISGNGGDGVVIFDDAQLIIFQGQFVVMDADVVGTVQGNFIGTDVSGTQRLANAGSGVRVVSAAVLVGGTAAGEGNLISGNGGDGVAVTGIGGASIQGNRIGTDQAGTAALGNAGDGVSVSALPFGALIGGAAAGARNLISGNGRHGILLSGSPTNTVRGNFIGTDVTGTLALGNAQDGVAIVNTPDLIGGQVAVSGNTVGGAFAGAGNLISGNGGNGVTVSGSRPGETIQGNRIGTQADGVSARGNAGHGVRFTAGAVQGTVGGATAGAGNTIAFNGGAGVFLDSGSSNAVSRNAIFANAGLGIDLGAAGVTPNDPGDADAGANGLQNFPQITRADSAGGGTTVTGTLNSTANTTFTVEVFTDPASDPSGFGEGRVFVGSTTATTDADGNASFSLSVAGALPARQRVTATATDPAGNTSEFAANAGVNSLDLSVNDVSVVEGDAGTADAVFTVRLSAASGQTVTVHYQTADGTAAAGSDYQAASGTLTFNPGDLTKTVAVAVQGDTLSEADETFFLNLSAATNADIFDGQGQGTIQDNDPAPALSVDDVAVTEGDAGTADAVFTVRLSAASGQTITVHYQTADGTAAGSDYQAVSGTLTFNPGDLTKTVAVPVVGDALDEADETFFLNLSAATNADIFDGQGQGTIQDNDPAPALSVDDVAVTEGDAGTVNAVFTVRLSAASGQQVTVAYQTADGTAAAGPDYQAASGTLTFGVGETTKTVTVTVQGDTLSEANETFFLNLSNAVRATLGDGQGQGTINDDDPLPALSVDSVAVTEGDAGTAPAAFTVRLSAASGQAVTVRYTTADGTALAPGDYQAASGQLTFAPGETSKAVAVPVVGDTAPEATETFSLVLSAPTAATLANAVGSGVVLDNDPPGPPAPPPAPGPDTGVSPGPLQVTDVTALVSIRRSKLRRRAGGFRQRVTLSNVGGLALTGPLSLVLDGLAAKVKLRGAGGLTRVLAPLGSPFVDFNLGGDGVLGPGEEVTVLLKFKAAAGRTPRYRLRLLAGPGTR